MKKPKRDLYAELGVNKTATTDQIKKAFRKKARTTHPDKNGKVEEFHAVSSAYLVLRDKKLRDHYDATGEIDDTRSDSNAALSEFIQTVMQIVTQETDRPVLDTAKNHFTAKIDELEELILKGTNGAKKLRECATRFLRKSPGDNVLSGAMEAQAGSMESMLIQYWDRLDMLQRARAMCDDYSYTFPKKAHNFWEQPVTIQPGSREAKEMLKFLKDFGVYR